ncbi:hypothetical protein AB833_09090 [Chromatiales bacterium (ex Bugula neritina AB1)]|nr:hypothetical protein AB833_09090 [Chromatiales bacterium (ex Bugula neritina AB1)]
MSMLKDVRLILIVVLAALCLIALKTCAGVYKAPSTASAAAVARVNADAPGGSAQMATDTGIASTVEEQKTDTASGSTGTKELTPEQTDAVARTENVENQLTEVKTAPVELEAAKEEAKPTTQTVSETASETGEQTPSEASVSGEESVSGVEPVINDAEVAEDAAAESEPVHVAENTETDIKETPVESGSAVAGVPEADAVSPTEGESETNDSTMAVSTKEPSTTGNTETGPSALSALAIPQADTFTVNKLNIKDNSATGEFLTDFNADIEAVREGLAGYTQKLETARELLDKASSVKR